MSRHVFSEPDPASVERICGMSFDGLIRHIADRLRGSIPALQDQGTEASRIIAAQRQSMLLHLRCIETLHRDGNIDAGGEA